MEHVLKDALGAPAGVIPELNYDLLEEAVSWAKWSAETPFENQKNVGYTWDQASWGRTPEEINFNSGEKARAECGSSFCISGYAAMAEGYTATERIDGIRSMTLAKDKVQLALNLGDEQIHEDHWDADFHWEALGAKLLGLTNYEASQLFNGDNDIERVIDLGNQIALHRGYPELNLDQWYFKLQKKETQPDGSVHHLGGMVKKDPEWYDAEVQKAVTA